MWIIPHRLDPDRLDQRDERFIRAFLRVVRVAERWFRAEVRGVERVPPGPVLFVGNHSGGVLSPDTFLFGAALYRARGLDAVPFGLAHDMVCRIPWLNRIAVPLGGVRASRRNAGAIFDAGRSALVYPGGDVDSVRPWVRRNRIEMNGRRGYIRLALRCGVPIVPVVSVGGHSTFLVLADLRRVGRLLRLDRIFRYKTLPLTLSIPWGLTLGPMPPHLPPPVKILVEVLPAIRFDRQGEAAARDCAYVEACAHRVESTMQACLDRLAAEREGSR
jgi:1-acyl-sn-glycerol-3-phosphate acyltransferase